MKKAKTANCVGILSLILTTVFWAYVESNVGPNRFTKSPYVLFAVLPGMLVAAAIAAIAAAFLGSKWWFLALAGPLAGAILMFTASA